MSKGCWEINRSRAAPVRIPPRCKDRLWVTRGQVCTGNQMFFSAQLPVSSQTSSLAELVHLSWISEAILGGGGMAGGLNI